MTGKPSEELVSIFTIIKRFFETNSFWLFYIFCFASYPKERIARTTLVIFKVLLRREFKNAKDKYSETEKALYEERNTLEMELESQVIYTYGTLYLNPY